MPMKFINFFRFNFFSFLWNSVFFVLLFCFLVPVFFYFEIFFSENSNFRFFVAFNLFETFDFICFQFIGIFYSVCFNFFSYFIVLVLFSSLFYIFILFVIDSFDLPKFNYFSFFFSLLLSFYLSFEFFNVLRSHFLYLSWLEGRKLVADLFVNSGLLDFDSTRMWLSSTFTAVAINNVLPQSSFFHNCLPIHFAQICFQKLSQTDPSNFYTSSFHNWFLEYFGLSWDNIGFLFMVAVFFPFIFLVALNFFTGKETFFYSFVLLTLNVLCFSIFSTLNFFVFYILFELMVIPMTVLIIKWGSTFESKSLDAGYRFFFYAFVTSIPLVYSLVILYFEGFYNINVSNVYFLSYESQLFLFPFLIVPFLAKIPLFPFHTWLPFAHAEASTVGSLILAALLLKISFFGLIRFIVPLCFLVIEDYRSYLEVLVVLSSFYTSFSALVQIDLKRIIAYSSIAHMSVAFFAYLNFTLAAFDTVILYSIAHAVSASALFFLVGILYSRTGQRNLHIYADLFTTIPKFSLFFIFFTLVNVAFPFTSGFVVEFLSFLHTIQYDYFFTLVVMISTFFVTSVSYWTIVRVLFYHYKTQKTDPIIINNISKNVETLSNNFTISRPQTSFMLRDLTYFEQFLLYVLTFSSLFLAFYPESIFYLSNLYIS